MKVAQIAPLHESVPPKQYGGTERVVSYLTEELVKQGHEVTLFASGDSSTSARLIPGCQKSLRIHAEAEDPIPAHLAMLEEVRRREGEFDILHFHTDYLHYPLVRTLKTPSVTTLHGRQDLPYLIQFYDEFIESNVVSISDSQRAPLPWLNWKKTVHHGLPKDLYKFNPRPRGYAAFLGRISKEKRPDRAIEIARRLGLTLKIAAKVSLPDRPYYEEHIKPLMDVTSDVEFIGEIGEKDKNKFLGEATVLLFPIDWPEPFGLVMIEAMACGTPTLAFRNGSVPEVIKDGVNGFVVDNIEDAIRAVDRIGSIDRAQCREYFEKNFSVEKMTENYLALYNEVISEANLLSLRPQSRPAFAGWDTWKTSSSITT